VVRVRPSLLRPSFRSLRLQVSVALLAAVAAFAYIASRSTGDELEGAYRDSALTMLQAATMSFERDLQPDNDAPASAMRRSVRQLMLGHPELESASVYQPHVQAPMAVVGSRPAPGTELALAMKAMRSAEQTSGESSEAGRPAALMVTPLEDDRHLVGALAVSYDLRPAHELLAERNESVVLVLGVLLICLALFTMVVLGRGIFRPLHRLRLATQAVGAGNLATRLGWRRQDELGQLARDFDAMAADLEENHRRLEQLAHRDPLTGLANHRRFQELLGDELELARRNRTPLAVVILDIDDFKRINDSRGHPHGDELLGRASESLCSALRGLAVVGRVGGDEFGLVVPDADRSRAIALAEAGRTAVEAAAPVRGSLRCSAGIACYPSDARNAGALLQLANGTLAWAKQTGGGRSRAYDPEYVHVVTDEQREEFARLIARPHAVRPAFQPIVSLASGEAVGFEALARFDGKPGLPPSWWFGQAHRFGLGTALEAEAARAALSVATRPEGTFLSINLSPSALATQEVRELLPGDLRGVVIEITEEERVLDVDALQRHLDPLRARGARIAVDDAGEGYAGLQQVMSMRADIIKLDRALVADVHSDPAKIALIGSLVHFARSTGASICAEGIESLDELRVLIHLGVAHGQGWALGRPGEPWPRVNAEAASLCRELRSEEAKIVPLGALAARRGA
jgi:diguanylate cyclase (GGDEF)-like protein